MEREHRIHPCPECDAALNRREFLATGATAALAAGSMSLVHPSSALAAPRRESPAEVAVRQLYDSLNDKQRPVVALPINHPNRTRISANWHVTEATVGEFFNKDQQQLIREVLKGVTSEDGYERFLRQMDEDDGGLEEYAVAIFGTPHDGLPFQFELTGRHLTLRADGNTVGGAAFGGPIVYGHGEEGDHRSNLFYYQTRRANDVFQSLEGKQRESALLKKAPRESAVQLREDVQSIPGIACGQLSSDQKELVAAVLKDILRPYREQDVQEVMEILGSGGGLEQLRMSFYRDGDLGQDGEWDVWRVEGPTLVCHFRGAPHVHAYINIARRAVT